MNIMRDFIITMLVLTEIFTFLMYGSAIKLLQKELNIEKEITNEILLILTNK
jgi:hypothetical protein